MGGDDLAKRIQEGFTDFDVAIATPDMMGTVGRLGRILGPSGKMPNPKSGTVTFDVGKAVADVKAGKVEYRTDRTGIVHIALGKRSFDERELVENYQAVLEEIVRVKPAAAKGRYLRTIGPRDDGPGHPARHRPHPRPPGGGRGLGPPKHSTARQSLKTAGAPLPRERREARRRRRVRRPGAGLAACRSTRAVPVVDRRVRQARGRR